MKIVPLAQVKAQFSAYVDQVATEGPIIITRNGKAAAVLLAAAGLGGHQSVAQGRGEDLPGLQLLAQ
jgi:prevent-host-death family protein